MSFLADQAIYRNTLADCYAFSQLPVPWINNNCATELFQKDPFGREHLDCHSEFFRFVELGFPWAVEVAKSMKRKTTESVFEDRVDISPVLCSICTLIFFRNGHSRTYLATWTMAADTDSPRMGNRGPRFQLFQSNEMDYSMHATRSFPLLLELPIARSASNKWNRPFSASNVSDIRRHTDM